MSPLWLAIASTMSLPLWKTVFLISMPRLAKNPCWMPISSGNPFAIGSPSRVIVAILRCVFVGEPAAGPTRASRRAAAATSPSPTPARRIIPLRLMRYLPDLNEVARHVGCDYGTSGVGLLDSCPTRRNNSFRLGSLDCRGGNDALDVLLALDQPVDVRAELREVRQRLRRDLVTGPREADRDQLLDLGRRMREDDHPVREVDRLVDVVGDEEDRDTEL